MRREILIRKPSDAVQNCKGLVAAAFSLCMMLMCSVAVSQDTTIAGLATRDMLNEMSDVLARGYQSIGGAARGAGH